MLKRKRRKADRFFWPAAATLLLLLVGAYFLNLQYDVVDTSAVQYSNLFNLDKEASLFDERKASELIELNDKVEELKLEEGIFKYSISPTETTNIWVDNRIEEVEPKVDNTKVASAIAKQDLKYHVMGGCFSNKRNAERLVKKLINKGYEARLLGQFKNLHAC